MRTLRGRVVTPSRVDLFRMPDAIVTGSGGLVGSQAVTHLVEAGFDVVGLENDSRARYFGDEASTAPVTAALLDRYAAEFRSVELDIRDTAAVERIVAERGKRIEILVHAAAQPSHDWAARNPHTDFHVNATGTLNLLEAMRQHAPDATFVHCSTSKVYGDTPNRLPLVERGSRMDLPESHPYWHGIDTTMSIDASLHSLFGVSKAAADLLVQEYGRYFGMPTVCFRPGCVTGSAHVGTRDHGFLSYLMRCVVRDEPYKVFGYDGLQVRCNLHSSDLIKAVAAFHRSPSVGRGVQHRGWPLLELLGARSDRSGGGDLGSHARLEPRARPSHRRPSLVDQRHPAVAGGFSGLAPGLRLARDLARDPRRQRRAMARHRVKLSVVIPARDEAAVIRPTVEGVVAALRGAGADYEVVVVDDCSCDGTYEVVTGLAEPHVRVLRRQPPHGFGRAVRDGLAAARGDCVAIVMADGCDDPADLVRYKTLLDDGWDCVFGTRFDGGTRTFGYPKPKLVANRMANLTIRALFGYRYDDTTNAFKGYRRDVLAGAGPLVSNGFELTLELPLKAILNGHRFADLPISWRARRPAAPSSGSWRGWRYGQVLTRGLAQRPRRRKHGTPS